MRTSSLSVLDRETQPAVSGRVRWSWAEWIAL